MNSAANVRIEDSKKGTKPRNMLGPMRCTATTAETEKYCRHVHPGTAMFRACVCLWAVAY